MQAIDRLRYLEELFVNGVSQSDGRALSIETLLDILIVTYDECCNSTLRREKSISEFVEFGKFSFMILATLSLQCLFQYTTFKTVCKHCLHRYSTGSGHVTFEVVDHYDYGTKDHLFLPARRYASAGYRDRNVSVCPSVCPSVRHAPVLCQNEES